MYELYKIYKSIVMKKNLLFFILLTCNTLMADTPIFILHSYHESYPWTQQQYLGFKSVLNDSQELFPQYSMEYIDAKRRGYDKDYEEEITHYFKSKYQNYQPKLIYVTDDDALNFMLKEGRKLFPSAPIVFSGVNNLSVLDKLNTSSITGVFEKKDIISNFKLIKDLFPKNDKVFILGDGSTTADALQTYLKNDISLSNIKQVETVYEENIEIALKKLRSYKGKVVLLTTVGGFKDSTGKPVSLKQAIHKIKNAGDFVIISSEDTYIQQGVIGGYVNRGESQGEEAGKIAKEILLHPSSPIPTAYQYLPNWLFDIQALDEHDIKLPADIAEKAIYINVPETFFQKHYKTLAFILYIAIGIIFFGTLYFTRYIYKSRKLIKTREEHLATITQSMNKAQSIARLGSWDWDIKNNRLWWSDEIYRIFGLQPQEFQATYEAFLKHVHPDDKEAVNNAVSTAISTKTDYHIVHRVLKQDGSECRVLEEASLKLDEKGTPVHMVGIIHDITQEYEREKALQRSEKQYRDLVENTMVGIFSTDLEGKILYANSSLAKTLEYDSADALIGQNSFSIYKSADDRKALLEKLQDTGHVSNYELVLHSKNSLPIPVMISTTFDNGIITGMMMDMREVKASRKEIDKLSKVVEQIDDSVLITDKKGTITYANKAFFDHSGYTKDDVLGSTPSILKSGKYDDAFYKNMWATILRGDIYKGILINKKKNGDIFYEKKTITPFRDDQNNLIGFVSTGKDVTLETMMHQEMEYVASIDKLTGIYNRHKFEELFSLEAERTRRFSSPLSLILLDIDHFKSVNDTYGHDTGDDVLKHLCSIIKSNIRQIDIFARWGGEEFLILSPGTNLTEVKMFAEKLRLAVEEASFPRVNNITISIGLSEFEADDTFSNLFKRADKALYFAKNNGRNQVSDHS
jgi:diguanylate cyclase (GGDEF)-like protein/PAS domain S-box-containing protein